MNKFFFSGISAVAILLGTGLGHAQASALHGFYSAPKHVNADNHLNPILVAINNDTDGISNGAQKFIDEMATQAIAFLGDSSMSDSAKQDRFKKLLNDSFDMKTIGRFALGRYWRESTPDQRSEYQKLFNDMIIEVYSKRFAEYKGQGFKTTGVRTDSESDTIVSSVVIPQDGPEIDVDWRVRYKDGRYKVVDIIVEGVSMSVTQRSDFSSVIQRGGGNVQVLLAHLRGQ